VLWLLYICFLLLRALVDGRTEGVAQRTVRNFRIHRRSHCFRRDSLVANATSTIIMGGPNSGRIHHEKVFFFNVLALHVLAAFFIVGIFAGKVKYDVEILKEETESR
jgi:hypothetical protein